MASWDRQPGEGETAYEAFKVFLSLGGARSGNKVAVQLRKSHQLINRWATKYNWKARALDYDSNREKKLFATEIAEEKKRIRKVVTKKHELGVYFESLVRKSLARLSKKMDDDQDFLIFPKDMVLMTDLCFRLQEAEYPEVVNEQTGRRGIQALAESIKALADKTIEQNRTGR